jgi:TM2 domain-containing membrane protein YozV
MLLMFCTKCGKQSDGATAFCKSCGAAISGSGAPSQVIVVRAAEKSPALALVLSFLFAGLGQIYNDQIKKGVWIIIAHAISLVLIPVLVGIVTTPVIWIWSMIDAYKTAERINRGELLPNAQRTA